MEHVSDIEILGQIAGKLDAERSRLVKDHISGCSECARKFEEVVQTWDVLGEWEIESTGVDVAGTIVSRAEELNSSRNKKLLYVLPSKRLMSIAFRVAASIIIAVSIGAMSGVRSAQSELSINSVLTERPDYLAALGLQWSSDLNWSVLEEHGPDSEVE